MPAQAAEGESDIHRQARGVAPIVITRIARPRAALPLLGVLHHKRRALCTMGYSIAMWESYPALT